VSLSEDACAAMSSVLGFLQELEIYIMFEENVWNSLTRTRFTCLRVLRLSLHNAHGWDCQDLQIMLATLVHLEELLLEFPMCCGPRGKTLGSTHPLLKRFSFTACDLFPESDFLGRHRGLESLFLETEQPFSSCTDASSPKMLRALSVNEYSLASSPTLLDFPITHLRLREVDEDPDSLLTDAIRAFGRTLRCLELDIEGLLDEPIPSHARDLISNASALDELAIIRRRERPPPSWSSNLLTDLFTALGPAALVRAVRFRCDEALPQARLDDLGPLPPRLKYIGWDVPPTSLIYVLTRTGDKSVVANTLTRSPTGDWMTEGVLHFLGESWTP